MEWDGVIISLHQRQWQRSDKYDGPSEKSLSLCCPGTNGHSNPHPLSNCYQKESRQKVNWPSVASVQTRGPITIIIIKWNNIMWVVLLLLLSASVIKSWISSVVVSAWDWMTWPGTDSGLEHVLTMCGCCYGYAIIICRTFKNISYSAHSHTPGKSQTHPSIHPIHQSPVQSQVVTKEKRPNGGGEPEKSRKSYCKQ